MRERERLAGRKGRELKQKKSWNLPTRWKKKIQVGRGGVWEKKGRRITDPEKKRLS